MIIINPCISETMSGETFTRRCSEWTYTSTFTWNNSPIPLLSKNSPPMSTQALAVLNRMIENLQNACILWAAKEFSRDSKISVLKEARDEIASLHSAEDDGWIDIKETYPDWDKEYIVYDINDGIVTVAPYSTDDGKFILPSAWITHYKQLPLPPNN